LINLGVINNKLTIDFLYKNSCKNNLLASRLYKPKYTFVFLSLFLPNSIKNLRLFLLTSSNNNPQNPINLTKFNKIFVKQSYLLLV